MTLTTVVSIFLMFLLQGTLMSAVEQAGVAATQFSVCSSQCIQENLRAALEEDRADTGVCRSTIELLWQSRRVNCFSNIKIENI